MFFTQWIEVTSRAGKRRAFTFAHGMNMHRMESRRQPAGFNADQHAVRPLAEDSKTDDPVIFVFQFGSGSRSRDDCGATARQA
jgi:hypothetical protein